MNASIVVISEPGRTPLHLMVVEAVEVGRDCAGVLISDPGVSRRHLLLSPDHLGVRVSDLGSTNGTTLDGNPLHEPRRLTPGSVVHLGATTIVLHGESAAGAVAIRGELGDDLRATSIDVVAAAVHHEQPRVPITREGTVTIVFSDIEGSTERAVALGDAEWMNVLNLHNSIVRRQVARFGGTEVKSQGDGFMLSFPSARAALDAMSESQRALATWARSHPVSAVRVRVGVHTGEAIHDGSDLYGRHVVIAARVAAQARGGEILVSSLVREIVEARGDLQFGPERTVTLKGLSGSWRLAPLIWDR